MTTTYWLVNQTKREFVNFSHIGSFTQREIGGNPVSALLTTWYMLWNIGDSIQFVSDEIGDWPFETGISAEVSNYEDITHNLISKLVQMGVVRDEGMDWQDEDEPELFIRRIRYVWNKKIYE